MAILLFCIVPDCLGSSTIVLNEDLQLQPIETGCWLVVHRFPTITNNSMIVQCAEQKFIWVDTPVHNKATQVVHQWLCKTFDDPNIIQINTGFHNDNLGGNHYLITQNIPCYGPELTAKLLKERWPETAKAIEPFYQRSGEESYKIFMENKMVAPTNLFPIGKGLVLQVGQETIEVYFPGPSHADDNTVVYFHRRKILYGGCMIKSMQSNRPGFIADADMKAWPLSVQKVIKRFPQTRLIIPGHGHWGGTELLNHTIKVVTPVKQ